MGVITKTGFGEVETYLYYIGNESASRMIELKLAGLTMDNSDLVRYFGKGIQEGESGARPWIKLEAINRQDALDELKKIMDESFTN